MSKKHKKESYCCCENSYYPMPEYNNFLNIYNLNILLLIVLQFGTKCKKGKQCIDNSILFIITLFLLMYCSCFKKDSYQY